MEDFSWMMKHSGKVGRIALLGDSKFLEWCITLDRQFAKLMGVDEKYFDMSKLDEAWTWAKGI